MTTERERIRSPHARPLRRGDFGRQEVRDRRDGRGPRKLRDDPGAPHGLKD